MKRERRLYDGEAQMVDLYDQQEQVQPLVEVPAVGITPWQGRHT